MSTQTISETEFWNWFIDNKPALVNFIKSGSNDYTLYNTLTEKLKLYNEEIFPEITINSKDEFVLIISCGGIKAGIPYVNRLCDAAPDITNCIIQKFRQPGHITELNFNGLTFSSDEIKIKPTNNGGKFDIEVYIKGFSSNDNRYGNLAFLYLDHFIGEYNVMTKIGEIEFKKLGLFTKRQGLISLDELKKLIASTLN